ncbi:sulfite exporter TauE/SafE family protein [Uliginosibacterium gangwonense]|uniref:sulfite exporter TauE/SafE family protein n=1 Tax=Uliginosibacterium gangwonense TaxID=392736 RepID=UPI0003699097|nr:sulfite exporter TauE/SafE family protein [Uliginosibacterium gangwonense]
MLWLGIVIVMLAGFVQGVSCFGFALISLPILSQIYPLQLVVPLIVCLSAGTNILILKNCWRQIGLQTIHLLIISSLLAAPLGTHLLLWMKADALRLAATTCIAGFALLQLRGKQYPIRRPRLALLSVGALSGALNASISLSGPPVALFLNNQDTPKDRFRACITAYALILNLVTLASYQFNGLLTPAFFEQLKWLIPSMLLGTFIGGRCASYFSEACFKRSVLMMVILLAIIGMSHALYSLLPSLLSTHYG